MSADKSPAAGEIVANALIVVRAAREEIEIFERPRAQVSVGLVSAVLRAFWHIAKGRLTAEEPLYGALILSGEEQIGSGESDDGAKAVRFALRSALARSKPTKEGE